MIHSQKIYYWKLILAGDKKVGLTKLFSSSSSFLENEVMMKWWSQLNEASIYRRKGNNNMNS